MKTVTILRNNREETWNFIENEKDLDIFHKKLNDKYKTSVSKPYQLKLLKEGKKVNMNVCAEEKQYKCPECDEDLDSSFVREIAPLL